MNIFIASIQNNLATLTSEESWHCAKVLRKRVGEAVQLIDGKGRFYEGVLEFVSEKKCLAKIISVAKEQIKRDYYLHLAIAPTKQMDRIEWMLEKIVEIGINEISFIYCHHSERSVIKLERLHKIIESAVKQSLQAYLPKLNPVVSFKEIIRVNNASQNFIAHCFDTEKQDVKNINFKDKSTLFLIGPEGDFTKEEVDQAIKNNFKPVSIGVNRLRTETAGLYVCQAASILT